MESQGVSLKFEKKSTLSTSKGKINNIKLWRRKENIFFFKIKWLCHSLTESTKNNDNKLLEFLCSQSNLVNFFDFTKNE